VEHDRAGLEQHEAVLLEDRHLSKGLQSAVLRGVLVTLAEQARAVGKICLFERPADAQVAHLPARELRDPGEG
jgi:hypothetical protein